MNNYKVEETFISFDCGCQFEINPRGEIVFDVDTHNPNNTLNINCPYTYKILADGITEGIFQLTSQLGKSWCVKLVPTEIEHLIALGSLLRPGCLQSKDKEGNNITVRYERKKNRKMEMSTYHPIVDKILSKTYGENIFQEQSLELAKQCAGFSLSEADTPRKGIGKKITSIIADCKKKFIEKGVELGVFSKEKLEEIFSWIEASQRYSFNRCLSKDTIIKRMNSKNRFGTKTLTIEEMYNIKNNINYAKANGRLSLYKKWKRIKNYGMGLSLNEDGRIRWNAIVDIKYAGVKDVFRIWIDNGSYIDCTENHKFPTPSGEKLMCFLKEGDELYFQGPYEKSNGKTYGFSNINVTKLRTVAKKRQHNHETIGFMTGENNPGYTNGSYSDYIKNKKFLPNHCQKCGKSEGRIETHHIDGDRENSRLENLINLCVSCHKKEEYQNGRTKIMEKGYPVEVHYIISIEHLGKDRVYDVEMAGPNHNLVVNDGIVTSNSHATGYGIVAYMTAYEKAHFPLEYYQAWLLQEDKREEYANLINESKLFNINVYPPDLRDFTSDFYARKNDIYFGYNNIKGLIKKDIDALTGAMASKDWSYRDLGSTISWLQFLSVGLESVSSKTAEGLINAGALDCFGLARARMAYEYERWNRLTPGEKKRLTPEYTSLEEFVAFLCNKETERCENALRVYNEKSLKRASSTRAYKTELKKPSTGRAAKLSEIVKELRDPLYNIIDTTDSLIFSEENLLGVALTRHKTDEIANCAETATCLDIAKGKKGYNVLRVKIEESRPYRTRNDTTMAFLRLSDKSGTLSAIAFGKEFDEYQHLLTRGSVVFVSGEMGKQDSFVIKRCYNVS